MTSDVIDLVIGAAIIGAISGGSLMIMVFFLRIAIGFVKTKFTQGMSSNNVGQGIRNVANFFEKTVTDDLNQYDDKFFEIALKEIQSNSLDQVVWAKAMAMSDGNPDKCKSLYIKNRVHYFQELKKSKQAKLHQQPIVKPVINKSKQRIKAQGSRPNYWLVMLIVGFIAGGG